MQPKGDGDPHFRQSCEVAGHFTGVGREKIHGGPICIKGRKEGPATNAGSEQILSSSAIKLEERSSLAVNPTCGVIEDRIMTKILQNMRNAVEEESMSLMA